MTPSLLVALAAFALVSSVTPGPNNLMLMASGTNFGFRRTLPHMLGVALGFTFMILAVGAGMTTVLAIVPGLLGVIKWASVAYLLYLAWQIATAPAKPLEGRSAPRPMTFLQAAAFQWVNPKAWTMALTAVSAYIPARDPVTGLLVVAAVFGAINLPSVGLWAMMGVTLRRFLADPVRLRVFNVGAALTLVATLYPVVAGSH
jgi:threonine/homoserine/homoserine lactone efflux protein